MRPHEDGNYDGMDLPIGNAPHGRWIVGLSVGEGEISADAVMRPHPRGDYVQYDDYANLVAHIERHDSSCQDLCGRGEHEAVACGYRPYFENNGRRCPTCPVHDQLGFPSIKGEERG